MARGDRLVLLDFPRTLHIRTVAPLAVRIRGVAREEKPEEGEAASHFRRQGSIAGRDLRYFCRVDWGDPLLYHVCLNTVGLDQEEAVQIVLHTAPVMEDPQAVGRVPGLPALWDKPSPSGKSVARGISGGTR